MAIFFKTFVDTPPTLVLTSRGGITLLHLTCISFKKCFIRIVSTFHRSEFARAISRQMAAAALQLSKSLQQNSLHIQYKIHQVFILTNKFCVCILYQTSSAVQSHFHNISYLVRAGRLIINYLVHEIEDWQNYNLKEISSQPNLSDEEEGNCNAKGFQIVDRKAFTG